MFTRTNLPNRLVAWGLACALGLLGCLMGADTVPAGEARVFTNARGDTMKAVFLGKEGEIAVLQRVPDGNVVRIPSTQLSLDDQLWIREKEKREERLSPGQHGWKLVRIETESPADTVSVMGLNRVLTSAGEVEWDGLIPEGCWIEFGFRRSGHVNRMDQRYFLRYGGEENLRVKCDGQFAWVSRDGEDSRVFGMSVRDRGAPEKVRSDIERIKEQVDQGLSLTVDRSDALTEVLRSGVPVTAVTLDDEVKLSDVAVAIDKSGARVLSHAAISRGDLEIIGLMKSIEALRIGVAYRNPDPVDWEGLKLIAGMENLTTLQLRPQGESYSLGWLEGAENLRRLNVRGTNPLDDRLPFFSNLESLTLTSGKFDSSAIGKMKGLRVLFVGPAHLGPNGETLAALDKLRILDITGSSLQKDEAPVNGDAFVRLAETGVFSEVYRLNTNIDLNYRHFPSLRKVGLYSVGESRPGVAQLEHAPELDMLELSDVTNEDLEMIATFPSLRRLRTLSFIGCECDNFQVLSALPHLQNLEIRGTPDSAELLDVSAFRSLEKLGVMGSSIRRIEGVAGHPTLSEIYLGYCRRLESLGKPVPNTELKMLHIHNCNALRDIEAFSEAESLDWLAYYNNGDAIKPLPFHPSAGRLYRYENFDAGN